MKPSTPKTPASRQKWAYLTPLEDPATEMRYGTVQHIYSTKEKRVLCGLPANDPAFQIGRREPRRSLCADCSAKRAKIDANDAKRKFEQKKLEKLWGIRGPNYRE